MKTKSNLLLENENLKMKIKLEKMKNRKLVMENEKNVYEDFYKYINNDDLKSLVDYVDTHVIEDDILNIGLRIASENNFTDIIEYFLQHPNVDPSFSDNISIQWASLKNNIEAYKLLHSDTRVDPSDNDNSALFYASQHGSKDIVELLLMDERVLNGDLYRARFEAKQNDNYEIYDMIDDVV